MEGGGKKETEFLIKGIELFLREHSIQGRKKGGALFKKKEKKVKGVSPCTKKNQGGVQLGEERRTTTLRTEDSFYEKEGRRKESSIYNLQEFKPLKGGGEKSVK